MVFWLCLVFLFLLPFLDGGTNFLSEVLLLTLPLPLFLIGLSRNEFNFSNLRPSIIFSWLAFLGFLLISVLASTSLVFSIPAFFQILAIFLWFCLFLLASGYQFSVVGFQSLVNRLSVGRFSKLVDGKLANLNPRTENRGPITVDSLKLVTGLIFLVTLSLSLVSFYYLLPGVTRPPVGMSLVYASYGHNHLADVLLLSIPLALAYFLTSRNRRHELLLSLLILLYIVALVLTFSRGAFLVLPLVVLFVLLLAKPKLPSQKFLSWLVILLPIGLIGLIGVFSLSQTGLEAQLAQPQNWLVKQLVKPEFQAKRTEYWRQAMEGFAARPLTGFGWGTFELVALRFQKATAGWSNYTHNFYLQVLAEAGMLAFLSFLSFLGWVFYEIWQLLKKSKTEPFLLGGFGAILASSLHSFLDYDWHFPAVFLLFLLIVASILAATLRSPASNFYSESNRSSMKNIFTVRLAMGFLKKLGGLPARLSIVLLVCLAIIVFLFGQIEVVGEYFEQKGDLKKALQLSPWPAVRVRQLADKIFSQDFSQGEAVAQRIMALSSGDPSMNSWLGQKYEQHGKPVEAISYYQKSLEFNPLGNFYLYPRVGQIYLGLGQLEKRDELYQFFARKLAEVKIDKEDKRLAKTLYQIGLDYLREGKEEKALFWWQKAPAWAPWWSYFYIEAASLEIKMGDREAAKAILDKCLTYDFPRTHCQEYEKRLVRGKNFEAPGFWQERIRNIAD